MLPEQMRDPVLFAIPFFLVLLILEWTAARKLELIEREANAEATTEARPGSGAYLAPNVVGGVTPGSSLTPFRASFQSGTYALGAPRQFEFGLRISF